MKSDEPVATSPSLSDSFFVTSDNLVAAVGGRPPNPAPTNTTGRW